MAVNAKRWGRYLAPLTLGLAIALPLLNLVLWALPSTAEGTARTMAALPTQTLNLTARALLEGALISSVQVVILSYGFWCMAQVFKRFAKGEPFQTGSYVQRFGQVLVLSGLLSPVFRTLSALALSVDNPVGQRLLVLSFSSNDFILALVGALLMMLGLALTQAAAIDAENRQIV
jgi:hypothetical protein